MAFPSDDDEPLIRPRRVKADISGHVQPDLAELIGESSDDGAPRPTVLELPLGSPRTPDEIFPIDYLIPSNTDPNVSYTVTLMSPEFARCTCKGFAIKHHCSHSEKAKARFRAGLRR